MRRIREVEGMYVTRLCFRPDLHLTLEPMEDGFADYDRHVVISLPAMMTVQEKGSESVHLDPDCSGSNRLMLNDLPFYSFVYESCLLQCTAEDNGTLVLEFEHGRIEVAPFENAESWEMYNDRGFRMICMPGGEVATWSEDSPAVSDLGERHSAPMKLDRTVEFDDFWFLPLRKRQVSRCIVDAETFGLQFDVIESGPNAAFTLRIDGPFRTQNAAGAEAYLVPPDGVGPALRLPGRTVSKAFGYKDGRLELLFKDGTRMIVGTDENQAWDLAGKSSTDSVRIHAAPGAEPRVQVDY